jgi:anti-sigma regulatory factor (Ser/Thr protein kinase)
VQFEVGPSAAAWARNALIAIDPHVESELMADVRLLVSELVTNSLRHAELDAEDSIRLGVSVQADRVRVEVADSGKGFEFEGPADDPETVEGWGLYLVATLSDRWGVERAENGTTRVWFELDRAG